MFCTLFAKLKRMNPCLPNRLETLRLGVSEVSSILQEIAFVTALLNVTKRDKAMRYYYLGLVKCTSSMG